MVNTSDRLFRQAFRERAERLRAERAQTFRRTKVDVIPLQTGDSYVEPLMRFFTERARRFR